MRIGLPNEHLGSASQKIIRSPIFSTGVGLVQKGFGEIDWNEVPHDISSVDEGSIEENPINPPVGIGKKFQQMLEKWFSDDIN